MKSNATLQSCAAAVLAIALVGCQSAAMMPTDSCKPPAPQLEYYDTDDGGVYYPPRSDVNLMLYIEQLNNCIDLRESA
ncbi:hypothetical protein [Photobacterium leiognathi]|uniref:hypothetical protein n=1 Tax=Photobacterium leiognathi TaxID=553611 RepID=UPI002738BF3C|nr:hypothetical protein [Photobacterium leiognathi]